LNYDVSLLLVMTEDLLLALMASVIVSAHFSWGPAVWALSWLGESNHNMSWSGGGTNRHSG
jgi:hypothetical protein